MLLVAATLALLAAWVGVGLALLRYGARPAGKAFRREVDIARLCVDETAPVTLTLHPEVRLWAVAPHDVVVLLDNSESMGSAPGSPLWTARRALAGFIRRLPPSVQIAVVSFDHEAHVLCDLTADRRVAVGAVESIAVGGSTAIHLALDRAREVLADGRQHVQRTVVLLSDGGSAHGPALEAAERLAALPDVRLIGVGVGAAADAALMERLAAMCGPGRYVAMRKTTDIEPLFDCMAAVISNGGAWSGAVAEPIPVPEHFDLNRTAGLAPGGVAVESRRAVISWNVPVLDAEPAVLGYELTARTPGWHAVAYDDAALLWKLPDGSTQEIRGPRGPRVLVLPRGFGWAWPVLNPLFWMMAEPLVGRRPAAPAPLPAVSPPGERSGVPDLPELPEAPAYQASPEPALVVGLGRFGEAVANRFAQLLDDRGVGLSLLSITVIRLGDPVNRRRPAADRLGDGHRLNLCVDLRTPLRERRMAKRELIWLNSAEALGRTVPLNTVYGALGDRRLVRLAALAEAPRIAERLEAEHTRIRAARPNGSPPPLVALVASADDPEGSGLIGEVAHILGARGIGVTAVLAPASVDHEDAAGARGLAVELERLVELAGVPLRSERDGPDTAVRRLFDRVLVVGGYETDARRAERIAGLLWCWTTVREVPEVLRPLRMAALDVAWSALPDLEYWRWVRARALRQLVCEGWLGLQGRNLPSPGEADVEAAVSGFLRTDGGRRPPGGIVRTLAMLAVDGVEPGSLLLSTDVAALPADAPDHEQIAWCDAERAANLAYVRDWADALLTRQHASGRWGLPLLAASLVALVDMLRRAQQKVDRTQAGLPALTLRAQFLSAMLLDLRGQIDALRREIGRWIAQIAGAQPALTTDAPAPAVPAAALWLAENAATGSVIDGMPPAARRVAEACAESWLDRYGHTLAAALTFEVEVREGRVDIGLRLASHRIGAGDDLTTHLFALFDAYRDDVRKWPVAAAFPAIAASGIAQGGLRIGRHAGEVLVGRGRTLDGRDPFVVAALAWREEPVAAALHLDDMVEPAVYVHAEEVLAAHLISRVRQCLNRSVPRLPPLARVAVSNSHATWAFLADLTAGRLLERQGRWWIERAGTGIDLGPMSGTAGIEVFEGLLRRVVIDETGIDGRTIPPADAGWDAGPDEAWAALEAHPLLVGTAGRPEWTAWRTVVWGLALEHGRLPVPA